ncbi:hypothetical protein AB0J82_34735 [Asanoa sp. NPDC049518]|uniref:hypothetical protein n=1 Tax=unclassified Asanoa TaxID=2685164 RepID=UPI0034345F36
MRRSTSIDGLPRPNWTLRISSVLFLICLLVFDQIVEVIHQHGFGEDEREDGIA